MGVLIRGNRTDAFDLDTHTYRIQSLSDTVGIYHGDYQEGPQLVPALYHDVDKAVTYTNQTILDGQAQ